MALRRWHQTKPDTVATNKLDEVAIPLFVVVVVVVVVVAQTYAAVVVVVVVVVVDMVAEGTMPGGRPPIGSGAPPLRHLSKTIGSRKSGTPHEGYLYICIYIYIYLYLCSNMILVPPPSVQYIHIHI